MGCAGQLEFTKSDELPTSSDVTTEDTPVQQSRKQVAGKPRQGQAGRAGKGSARNPKPSEDAGSQADSKQLAGPKQKEDAGSKADTKMGDNAKPEEDQGSSAEAEKAEEPKIKLPTPNLFPEKPTCRSRSNT